MHGEVVFPEGFLEGIAFEEELGFDAVNAGGGAGA